MGGSSGRSLQGKLRGSPDPSSFWGETMELKGLPFLRILLPCDILRSHGSVVFSSFPVKRSGCILESITWKSEIKPKLTLIFVKCHRSRNPPVCYLIGVAIFVAYGGEKLRRD